MKMSLWRSQGVLQSGVAVIKRDATIESVIEEDFGSGKAEAAGLLGDLEALALPLHDVVVADDTFMNEANDAIQILRSRTPSGRSRTRRPGEAAVVVGEEGTQNGIGGIQINGASQAQFAAEAILQHAPEALDAALGLWGLGGDESDAELSESVAELGGLAFCGELFLHGPSVVVADKDAAAIAIKGQGHTVTLQELTEQREIAESRLGGEELGREDFAGGVILHTQSRESGGRALAASHAANRRVAPVLAVGRSAGDAA